MGGQQCLVNGVVYPEFSQNCTKPSSVTVGPKPPTNPSRKRPSSTVNSTEIPEFGIPINPKVHASQGTRRVTTPPAEPQSSVPAAFTHKREAPQVNRVRFAMMQNDNLQMTSQPEPEKTSVEPPPIQSSNLPLNPAILDRINSFGAISISRVNSSSPIDRRRRFNPRYLDGTISIYPIQNRRVQG